MNGIYSFRADSCAICAKGMDDKDGKIRKNRRFALLYEFNCNLYASRAILICRCCRHGGGLVLSVCPYMGGVLWHLPITDHAEQSDMYRKEVVRMTLQDLMSVLSVVLNSISLILALLVYHSHKK